METSSAQRSASEALSQSPSCSALSMYETARRHCRERILVQPLLWTRRHLELLQCSFSDPRPAPPTAQFNSTGARDGTECLSRFFLQTHKYVSRECAIRAFLAAPECPLDCRTDIYLSLGDCRSVTLPCTTFGPRDEAESESTMLPIAAHIERGHIASMRREMLQPYIPGPYNRPVVAMRATKLKTLVPTEPLHDPYIAALLIALAQYRRRMLDRDGADEKADMTLFPLKVLCTNEDKELMHLYSATIPSSLLDKFDHPSVPPPETPSISIQITSIPYKPLETLRDRLLALILPTASNHKVERKRKMRGEDEDTQPLSTRRATGDLTTCV
ncbi:Uncharacterized protein TPAR_02135 [Tolypocladium paradoxum]|uniref:Uncharacterized protein n=1 Tax=Tolypocladium paradoxum TaxID=94208 RepID=A0A2S4L5G4_9HYPO|nr:Uncharacterized protein TPAR_02135 [Tolypocladium paradoxum]